MFFFLIVLEAMVRSMCAYRGMEEGGGQEITRSRQTQMQLHSTCLKVKGRAKLQTDSEAKEKKEWRGRSEEGRLTTTRRISSTSMRKMGKLNLPSLH